jgi:hypothetical protein
MSSFADSAKALVDPVDGSKRFIEARRIVLPLLILAGSVALSGAAFASRWDAGPAVLTELAESGDLAKNTEQEIADKIQTKERAALVGGVAKGLLLMPLLVLAFAALLKFAGWLLATSLTYVRALSVAVLSLMPMALYNVIFALSALRQQGLREGARETLVPTNLALFFPDVGPKLSKLLSTVDFFNLWGVALLGLGFAAASGMRRSRALILALVLYAMFEGVFRIGLPAMGGGR